MAITNDDYGTQVGTGFMLSGGLGLDLEPDDGVIKVTDLVHFLTGSGTITTIEFAGEDPSTPNVCFLIRRESETCIFGSGGNIVGPIPAVIDLAPIMAIWDGDGSWSLMAANPVVGSYLTADGTTTGATTQAQRFTVGAFSGDPAAVHMQINPSTITAFLGDGVTAAARLQTSAPSVFGKLDARFAGKVEIYEGDNATLVAVLNKTTGGILAGFYCPAPVGYGYAAYLVSAVGGLGLYCQGDASGTSAEFSGGDPVVQIKGSNAGVSCIQVEKQSGGPTVFRVKDTGAVMALLSLTIGAGAIVMTSGTGSPEGAVTGSPGDLFLRIDGGAGTTMYVKETGSATNTGWVAPNARPTVSSLHTWAGNGETITTSGISVARNIAVAARTGAIMAAGTYDGQPITVDNEDTTAGNSITFAAVGTSRVANGVTTVINGLTQKRFVWMANAATPAWYPG